ncbi:MAG: hypothetical protein IPO58_01205 [Betaproteobacteria bacterium]|nr:hypothetical protein [Betaproteobacteria bacterium]
MEAEFIYNNNGPGKGDGGVIHAALPASVSNWVVTCQSRNGAICPASLNPDRLREGQPLAIWPAGGGITLKATGTVPTAAASAGTTLEFGTTAAPGNGSPDPTPGNDAPPPAQTTIRGVNNCAPSLTPASLSFGASAQAMPATLWARPGCAWTAQSSAPWLSVGSTSGTGRSTLTITVQVNTTGQPRTGTLSVGLASVFVVQAGVAATGDPAACSNLRLQREGDQTPAAGLSGATSVGVFADGQCGWAALSDASWISLTAGGAGNGNGTVSYVAQPNADTQVRSATITVGEKNFVVNQLGQEPGSNTCACSDGGGDSGGGSGGDSGGSSGGDSG